MPDAVIDVIATAAQAVAKVFLIGVVGFFAVQCKSAGIVSPLSKRSALIPHFFFRHYRPEKCPTLASWFREHFCSIQLQHISHSSHLQFHRKLSYCWISWRLLDPTGWGFGGTGYFIWHSDNSFLDNSNPEQTWFRCFKDLSDLSKYCCFAYSDLPFPMWIPGRLRGLWYWRGVRRAQTGLCGQIQYNDILL